MPLPNHAELLDFARDLAAEAGRLLMTHFGTLADSEKGYKGRRNALTVADTASERLIVARIHEAFPDHDIIAEETAANGSGGNPDRRWVVDPLDATVNFSHGYPLFAVSIALLVDERPFLGVVHAPAMGETFWATAGNGAFLNSAPIAVSKQRELKNAFLATGFSYNRNETPRNNLNNFNAFALRVEGLRRGGCAALDLCYTAMGRFDGYWEMFLEPWDVAAGALIVREAGGRVTDFKLEDNWLWGDTILAGNGTGLHEAMADLIDDPPGSRGVAGERP